MVVRKEDSSSKKSKHNDTDFFNGSNNLSDNVSLDIIEVEDYLEKGKASFNRIYQVFDGEMQLTINGREIILCKGDGVFIEKGMTYEMKGTFKAAAINKVAF